jgi:SulP family sulfate permease
VSEPGPTTSLRGELRPSRLIPTITAGLVIGVLEVVLATSFAALVFRGDAAAHLPIAIGLSLFGGATVLIIVAFRTSLPGVVGSAQDVTAVILGLVTGAITAQTPGALHHTFLTLVAVIIVSTLLTGVFLLVLGRFNLGNIVRFVPYPVVGGFLAGTGWLLFKGGVGILVGRSLSLQTLHRFARPDPLLKWVPGVLFAIVLLLLLRRFRHFLIIPSAVVLGVAAFYVVLFSTGKSTLTAKIHGFLLGPFPYGEDLWEPATLDALTNADWGLVLGQAAGILAVPLVAVLALLLNASGIELIRNRDLDINQELRAAGWGNLAASVGGGIPGFQALSLTALAHRAGSTSRFVGLVAAAVCGVTLFFGADTLSLFPRMVLGGLVVFLGLSFLVDWVLDAWRRLPRRDYLVVLLILLAVAALGFLPGVAVGLVAAIVLFVVDYSRTNVVKHTLTGATFRSSVERDPRQSEILRREGAAIHILELQGFVFFGTANSLLERIRMRAGDADLPSLRWLVIDFRRVHGIDTSAALAFSRIVQLAAAERFDVIYTEVEPRMLGQLRSAGVPDEPDDHVHVFPDLDRGVEWCEQQLLAERGAGAAAAASVPLVEELRATLGNDVRPEALLPYLEPRDLEPGEHLIRQGDEVSDVFFLERGRLTVQFLRSDGSTVRLQTMTSGTVVGEVAMYLGGPRTASVVADVPSRIHRLSPVSLSAMERDQPALASAIHRMFARLLAERLSDALRAMDALRD